MTHLQSNKLLCLLWAQLSPWILHESRSSNREKISMFNQKIQSIHCSMLFGPETKEELNYFLQRDTDDHNWKFLTILAMWLRGWQRRSVGPPLWSRLKYLNNYRMDCRDIWYTYPCCPEDECCQLWWSPDFSSSANCRFVILNEMSREPLGGFGTFDTFMAPSGWIVITLVNFSSWIKLFWISQKLWFM